MFTFHRSLWVTATFTALAISLSGCAGCEFDELGCSTDEDCKSGRVCGADNVCIGTNTNEPDAQLDLTDDEDPDLPIDNQPDGVFDQPIDTLPDQAFDVPPDQDFDMGLDESFDVPFDQSFDAPFDVPFDVPFDQNFDVPPDQVFDVPPDQAFDMVSDQGFDESPDLPIDMTPVDETPDSLDMTPDLGPDEGEDMEPDMGLEPQIRVTPQDIDFGTNPLNTSIAVNVMIENIGVVDLEINDVSLRTMPSQGFSVGPMIAPVTLQPGQSRTITVTFTPSQAARYANDLEIQSNDADEPLIRVDLRGRGFTPVAVPCLYASPDAVDFGVVTPGNAVTRDVIVGNCSSGSNVTVTGLTLRSGAMSPVSVSSPQTLPFVLGVGQTETVTVTYTPVDVTDMNDVLRVRSDSALGPISRVDLTGSGGGCPTMVAQGESNAKTIVDDVLTTERVFVVAGDVVDLDATLSTSPSGRVEPIWSLAQSPAQSSSTLSPTQSARAQFRTIFPGRYVIELDGIDPVTGNSACATDTLDVIVLPNMPELIATMTWDAAHDVDLHLLRSDAQGNWPLLFDPLNDLSYDNIDQDWDGTPNVSGDAFHYGDDLDGFGPEHLIVANFDGSRNYRIVVQFTRILNPQPRRFESTLELTVNPPGSMQTQNRQQTRQFTFAQQGQEWIVYEISGNTGTITLVNMP